MRRGNDFSPISRFSEQVERQIQRDTHIALGFLALGSILLVTALFWI